MFVGFEFVVHGKQRWCCGGSSLIVLHVDVRQGGVVVAGRYPKGTRRWFPTSSALFHDISTFARKRMIVRTSPSKSLSLCDSARSLKVPLSLWVSGTNRDIFERVSRDVPSLEPLSNGAASSILFHLQTRMRPRWC